MKVKYYSEILDKTFDSEEELRVAEEKKQQEEQKKNELSLQRKEKAAEIQEIYNSMLKLTKDYNENYKKLQEEYYSKIKQFVETYGSYHFSYNSEDVDGLNYSINTDVKDILKSIYEPLRDWLF